MILCSKNTGQSSSSRKDWQHTDLQKAVRGVFMSNVSKKKAASMYGIPRSTLQRYTKQCENDGSVDKKERGRQTTLSREQESELCSILFDMGRRLYGLRPQCVRKIVYQYCVENNIPHTFSDEDKSAEKKWLKLFLTQICQYASQKECLYNGLRAATKGRYKFLSKF